MYGSRPRRLTMRSSIIRDVRIKAHLWPFLFSGVISCFVIRLANHSCRVERRLLIHRLFGDGSSRAGNSIESRISGMPNKHGLVNWSKKLRFMVRFRRRFWGLLWAY